MYYLEHNGKRANYQTREQAEVVAVRIWAKTGGVVGIQQDDIADAHQTHLLTLPDGYSGRIVALSHAIEADGHLVKLAVANRPWFTRWARLSDRCETCGQTVSDHLPITDADVQPLIDALG